MLSRASSQIGLLLCPKLFLWVSRSTGLPSPFKEWSSQTEHDYLEKETVNCHADAVRSVPGQSLLFLTAPGWRRSSNKVCNLLPCIACGVRVTVKLFSLCVFHSNTKGIASSVAVTLIYHTASTLTKGKIKTRSSEIAHLTEEETDHNACWWGGSLSVFYSLWKQHAMGLHNACSPVCSVPLIHTRFVLGSFPVLHTDLLKIRL